MVLYCGAKKFMPPLKPVPKFPTSMPVDNQAHTAHVYMLNYHVHLHFILWHIIYRIMLTGASLPYEIRPHEAFDWFKKFTLGFVLTLISLPSHPHLSKNNVFRHLLHENMSGPIWLLRYQIYQLVFFSYNLTAKPGIMKQLFISYTANLCLRLS